MPERVAHEEEGRADVRPAAHLSTPNGRAPLLRMLLARGFCTSRGNFARVTGLGWAVRRRDLGGSASAELMVDPESGTRCAIRRAGGGRHCA